MTKEQMENIIQENMQKIYLYCVRRLENTAVAEDVASEIILELLRSHERIINDEAVYGYIWSVANNLCRNYWRRKEKENYAEIPEDFIGVYCFSPEESFVREEEIMLLRRELSLLREKYRHIMISFYIGGKSCEEMGYANECTTKEREDFFVEVNKLETPEKILRHREMLQKYPNDTRLQFSLANLLYYKLVKKCDDVDAEQELRLLCYRILHGNLPDMQCGAKRLLALISAKNGDMEAAMKYVNELPSVYCGREIMAEQILHGLSFKEALDKWLERKLLQ